MKNIILFIFMLNIFLASAQNQYSEIKYSFITGSGTNLAIRDCTLFCDMNNNMSTFINFGFVKKPAETKKEKKELNGDVAVNIHKYVDNDQIPEYQKFFKNGTLISYESVYGEKQYHIMTEKLPKFEWEILRDTMTILNYKTQKAKVHFRGRDYFAWFTPKIKISDGPYKFYGLPGLILKIQSADKEYTFEVYAIKLNEIKEDFTITRLTEKYPRKKVFTIIERLNLIEKNIEKTTKYMLSKNPNMTEVKIELSGMELNYNDVIDVP